MCFWQSYVNHNRDAHNMELCKLVVSKKIEGKMLEEEFPGKI